MNRKQLRDNLFRYNAKIIKGKFLSITEKDYQKLKKNNDLMQEVSKYKIQLRMF